MKFWQRFGKLVSCGRVDDSNQSLDSHIKEHFLKFKRIKAKMDGLLKVNGPGQNLTVKNHYPERPSSFQPGTIRFTHSDRPLKSFRS